MNNIEKLKLLKLKKEKKLYRLILGSNRKDGNLNSSSSFMIDKIDNIWFAISFGERGGIRSTRIFYDFETLYESIKNNKIYWE